MTIERLKKEGWFLSQPEFDLNEEEIKLIKLKYLVKVKSINTEKYYNIQLSANVDLNNIDPSDIHIYYVRNQ